MSGNGSSSWPTARASEQENRTTRSAPSHGLTHGEVLAGVACDFMETWQTPRVSIGPYTRNKGQKGAERLTLEGQSLMWGTPRASDAEKGGPNQSFGAGGTPLPAQTAQWSPPVASARPTPASRDWKGENGADHLTNGTGRLHLDQLPNFVAHCFTPPAQRTWTSGVSPSIWRPISRRLFRSAMSSVSPTARRRWLRKGSWRKRRLNPSFVEWLMSWPPGHAVCACSETGFIHWQQHMRGALSALPTASGPWIWEPPSEASAPKQMSLWG
jgi:hypothetical protein